MILIYSNSFIHPFTGLSRTNIIISSLLTFYLSWQSTAPVSQRSCVQISYRRNNFQALFSLLLKQCSVLRTLLSYSFLNPQFTYVIFIYSPSRIIYRGCNTVARRFIGSCPNLNHKILFFSASLSTLKAIQHELNKNSPLSRRNFRELNSLKILRSYSVPSKCFRSFAVRKMYLHLRRFNISKNKQSTLT